MVNPDNGNSVSGPRSIKDEKVKPSSVIADEFKNAISNGAIQTAWDGLVVPIGNGFGMSDAIHPSSSSTPISDAVDALRSASDGDGVNGQVLIPPQTIENDGPINAGKSIITGFGIDVSIIKYPATSYNGYELNEDYTKLDGVTLRGPGPKTESGHAIVSGNSTGFHDFGTSKVEEWGGSAIQFNKPTYFTTWDTLNITNCYPLDNGYVIDWQAGTTSQVGTTIIENTAGIDNSSHSALRANADVDWRNFEALGEIGDKQNPIIYCKDRVVNFGLINIESLNQTWHHPLAAIQTAGTKTSISYNKIRFADDLQYLIYGCRPNGGYWGHRQVANDASLTRNTITLRQQVEGPTLFAGRTDEVENTGLSTERFFCAGDAKFADPRAAGTVTHTTNGKTRIRPTAFRYASLDEQNIQPKIQTLRPVTTGQATVNYPIPDTTFIWDDSSKHWNLILDWDGLDPGTDIEYDIEIVSKGI